MMPSLKSRIGNSGIIADSAALFGGYEKGYLKTGRRVSGSLLA